MNFPDLKCKARDREYKSFPEQLRDKVIYEYLFSGQSHRWLDENILGWKAGYSRGWQSMGILHHLGLVEEHKGIFADINLSDAVQILSEKNSIPHKLIASALTRNWQGVYSDESLEMFKPPHNAPKLHKRLGTSQYTDGVRIDKDFHDIFNPPDSPLYTKRGTARKIKVLFNNKVFDAEYRFENQEDTSVVLQSIRFRKELKAEFKRVFPLPEGEFSIYQGFDLNHLVFEHFAESFSSEDDAEYPEGKSAFRIHKIRERNAKVVKIAKESFKQKHDGKLFCECCELDYSAVYGDRGKDFIEGHHKKLVSDMDEGEKTKPEDIAMLCSSCHRMIHRKPLLTVEKLKTLIMSIKAMAK